MTSAPASTGRLAAIDLTKGVLVVCMVIYHSLNYSAHRELAFKFLAFLPPSFILITGFLLSHVYLAGYSIRDWRLHSRLVMRGLRLLILFTLLNVLVQLLVTRGPYGSLPGLQMFWDYRFETYVSGDGSLAVFEVLLPIAYLLLLAPILLCLERLHSWILPVITALTLAVLAYWERQGMDWLNSQLLAAGLIGMLLGRIRSPALNRLAGWRWIAIVAYAACFAVGYLRGHTFLVQLLSAAMALALIYAWMVKLHPEHNSVGRRIELLGRYSLVAYIVQIGILQVFSRVLGRPAPDSVAFLAMLVGTLILTVLTVEILNWMRSRSATVGSLYKVVFA